MNTHQLAIPAGRQPGSSGVKRHWIPAFAGMTACMMLCSIGAAIDLPPRLYFSDARLSATIAEPWTVPSSFPFGPMLTRKTQEGTDAHIVCQISETINSERLTADVSTEVLKDFADKDLSLRSPGARLLAGSAGTIAGQNAYEITWLIEGPEGATQHQSVYFFVENRFYVLTLKAQRDSFPWIVQDFQTWLKSVHLLSRQAAGKLSAPSRGGLWVHQTGGAKIEIPENWLIGVADDRTLGATTVRDKMHLAFTAGVEGLSSGAADFKANEREEARRAILEKGRRIVEETSEPFHGLPAFQILYEDTVDGRFVRGQDIWIQSPRARWLISVEGDSRLMRQVAEEWQGILSSIHFYE